MEPPADASDRARPPFAGPAPALLVAWPDTDVPAPFRLPVDHRRIAVVVLSCMVAVLVALVAGAAAITEGDDTLPTATVVMEEGTAERHQP